MSFIVAFIEFLPRQGRFICYWNQLWFNQHFSEDGTKQNKKKTTKTSKRENFLQLLLLSLGFTMSKEPQIEKLKEIQYPILTYVILFKYVETVHDKSSIKPEKWFHGNPLKDFRKHIFNAYW